MKDVHFTLGCLAWAVETVVLRYIDDRKEPGSSRWISHTRLRHVSFDDVCQAWSDATGAPVHDFPFSSNCVANMWESRRKEKANWQTTLNAAKQTQTIFAELTSMHDAFSPGLVYYILDEVKNEIKIGWTGKSIRERMASMQTGNSTRLICLAWERGSDSVEKERHLQFAKYRIDPKLEWFTRHPELDRHIKELQDANCGEFV